MADEPLNIPDRTYDELRTVADVFLSKHHPTGTLPVPVEEIIEFQLGLDIIPMEGLRKFFHINGYVSKKLNAISVDEYIQETRPDHYRYVLAHELAHVIMHKFVVGQFEFETINEWKAVIQCVNPNDRSVYDGQAHELGSLILVPTAALSREFEKSKKAAAAHDLSLANVLSTEKGRLILESNLARQFDVPRLVMTDRTNRDQLWHGSSED